MERADHMNKMGHFHKSCNMSREENADNEKDGIDRSQTGKKPKRKRNSSSLSYIEMISYAILSSPHKRATLAEIYSFIQDNYPEFTVNRLRWKNTVRHNLSLHECFQRGEIAMDKAGCYWHIHPSFLPQFSRGDFSRRKLTRVQPLSLEGMSSLHENQFVLPSPGFSCHICKSTQPFIPPFGSLHFHRQDMSVPYRQNPYFPSRDHWMY